MRRLSSRDYSPVLSKRAPQAEVQRQPARVGDYTTRLLDEDRAGSMVPDLLDVACADGHAEVRPAVASRERAVLGLAIHPDGVLGNAESLRNARVGTVRGVRSFDGFEEVELVGAKCRDLQGLGVGPR